MKIRAVIFDVYNTLLEVGPPPADAAPRWDTLWRETLDGPAPMALQDFAAACERETAREHEAARQAGVAFPEVFWPSIAVAAAPELSALAQAALDEFLFRHAQLVRTVRFPPEAAAVLRQFNRAGVRLGIVSNSQPYTLRELAGALATAELNLRLFERDLCFWSFENGFSKPNPHVFRLLAARLRTRGITPAETLVVGDRLDNDIEPARRCGWRTWHLGAREPRHAEGGSWAELRRAIGQLGSASQSPKAEPLHQQSSSNARSDEGKLAP